MPLVWELIGASFSNSIPAQSDPRRAHGRFVPMLELHTLEVHLAVATHSAPGTVDPRPFYADSGWGGEVGTQRCLEGAR